MNELDATIEPDWDTPLTLTLTPAAIIHTTLASADFVHTGWETCIDHALVVSEMTVLDEQEHNHCRLVEQEYVEDGEPDVTWHDWGIELKIGDTYITAHWRARNTAAPSEWDWCAREAEKAFARTCVVVGKRVRRGIVVDEFRSGSRAPRTHH